MSHAAYKKIAVAGATGLLGSAILKELHESGLFEITVLVRESSAQNFPEGVKVAKVDFGSVDSLAEALAGQDALVSALATLAISVQKLLIDGAVKAGVKRIIPSEFGVDLTNPKARALPVYAGKVEIQDYLKDLTAKNLTSYTLIFNGPFLDSGLAGGLFFNFKERKAEIYDGGDQLLSVSRLATVGKAVRRVLTHPRETADRAIRVRDIDTSQNQLLAIAQALTPGEKWELKQSDTAEFEREALQQIKDNKIGPLTMFNLVRRAIFAPEFGSKFETVHNDVLGIREISTQDLEEIVHSAVVSK